MKIFGNVLSEGIAVGKICYQNTDYSRFLAAYRPARADIEKIRFDNAIMQAKQDLQEIIASKRTSRDGLDILKVHNMIISDSSLKAQVFELIDKGFSAPQALNSTIDDLSNSFRAATDPTLRERVSDVHDAGKKILRKLLGIEEPAFPDDDIIICANNLEPSVIAGFSEEHVKAVFLSNPSETSHTAIIARAKDFITITGFDFSKYQFMEKDQVLIDTFRNQILINPSASEVMEFNKRRIAWNNQRNQLIEKAIQPSKSLDGVNFSIQANISLPQDIDKAIEHGCSGVGLYRTEFLFMESEKLPTEDEQFEAYKEVVSKMNNNTCIIRTLDIGGDKNCACLNLPKESNPYLGFRGIRVSLENKSVFKTQLKAILRASAFGKAAIMLPMVTTLYEIKQSRKILNECKKELDAKGIEYDKNIPLGIMMETPSACLMADIFARNVDFFSIGTNDLIQYTFAADRTNPRVAHFFDCYEPAVIYSIYRVVSAAHDNHIPVGICGEMAYNTTMLPFFMALGVDELSMNYLAIPAIKELIRNTPSNKCDINHLLTLDSTKKVQKYLKSLSES